MYAINQCTNTTSSPPSYLYLPPLSPSNPPISPSFTYIPNTSPHTPTPTISPVVTSMHASLVPSACVRLEAQFSACIGASLALDVGCTNRGIVKSAEDKRGSSRIPPVLWSGVK